VTGTSCTFKSGEIGLADLDQLPAETEEIVFDATYNPRWEETIGTLHRFQRLRRLEMRRNCLQIRSPDLFKQLRGLVELNISNCHTDAGYNEVNDIGAQSIASLTSLTSLVLSR